MFEIKFQPFLHLFHDWNKKQLLSHHYLVFIKIPHTKNLYVAIYKHIILITQAYKLQIYVNMITLILIIIFILSYKHAIYIFYCLLPCLPSNYKIYPPTIPPDLITILPHQNIIKHWSFYSFQIRLHRTAATIRDKM